MHLRYCEFVMGYAQQRAACNALHAIKQRLCSWLLDAHDRSHGEILPFTQQLLVAGNMGDLLNSIPRRLVESEIAHAGLSDLDL